MGRPGDLASVFQLIDSSVFTHMPHDHVHINYRDRAELNRKRRRFRQFSSWQATNGGPKPLIPWFHIHSYRRIHGSKNIRPKAGSVTQERDARQAEAVIEGTLPDVGDRLALDGPGDHQCPCRLSVTIGDGNRITINFVTQVVYISGTKGNDC